ncbi:MAG: nitroreductase family protein [Flavobacteriales bacterium]|nr:nitroreductase family protein [Flavobacteriales bacterium]
MSRSELDIHPVINERYSPRAFSDRTVTDHELELLLEAARWAPSSMNEQPWRFLVTRRGGEGHGELLDALNPSNQRWADKAPVLILVMAKRSLSRNAQENHHARHDVGMATAHLSAQATALGMGLHILGGFHADVARKAFSIPEGMDIVSVIVLGFPGTLEQLEPDLRDREARRSPRKPLEEIVSYGRFKD